MTPTSTAHMDILLTTKVHHITFWFRSKSCTRVVVPVTATVTYDPRLHSFCILDILLLTNPTVIDFFLRYSRLLTSVRCTCRVRFLHPGFGCLLCAPSSVSGNVVHMCDPNIYFIRREQCLFSYFI